MTKCCQCPCAGKLLLGVWLTVGKRGDPDLGNTAAHRLTIGQGLDEHGVDADPLELLGAGHGLLPAEHEGIGAREDENIQALVAGVTGRLDAGIGLAPGDDRLSLGVATPLDESQYVCIPKG